MKLSVRAAAVVKPVMVGDLLAEYASVSSQIESLEKRKAELKSAIMKHMESLKVDSLEAGGYKATKYVGARSSISAEALLEEGVPPEVVNKATKVHTFQGLRVSQIKGGADGERG